MFIAVVCVVAPVPPLAIANVPLIYIPVRLIVVSGRDSPKAVSVRLLPRITFQLVNPPTCIGLDFDTIVPSLIVQTNYRPIPIALRLV